MRDSVLVTGGAGYIGSHACKALEAAGLLPVTYDNLTTGNLWAVKWGPFEFGDIHDRSRLLEVCVKHRPIAVIHFAASAYVGDSVADPSSYYRNNVAGSLALLDCMRLANIKRIVFSSSCATYGVPEQLPITEETPQRPINPYGRTKLMVEDILRDFGSAYGSSSVALRYFNAAGADPENKIGESHEPETHLVPLVLGAALNPDKPVTIFGTDYDTEDGTCVRDYVHVADLATAHVLALGYSGQSERFAAFNLGTGRGYSVRQIIDSVRRSTNRDVATVQGVRRIGDPASLIARADKAAEVLGWRPLNSDIDTIVRTAWAWMRR